MQVLALSFALSIANAGHGPAESELDHGSVLRVEADPDAGFEHAYLVFLPPNMPEAGPVHLLVEMNNTGKPSDDMNEHEAAAMGIATRFSLGYKVSSELGVPFLVPIFPRPASDWKIYTHALDRDTINVHEGPLKRLDLQLIAMIDDAQRELTERGHDVPERVLMSGFSASGTFANRFTMLHPHRVSAVVAGGINGLVMLPLAQLEGEELSFPLGLADYESITGRAFDIEALDAVAQLYFMGANDANDAVAFDDAYDDDERSAVHSAIGEAMQPDRWARCEQVWKDLGLRATFKTYEGVGHGTSAAINAEIAEFLDAACQQSSNRAP